MHDMHCRSVSAIPTAMSSRWRSTREAARNLRVLCWEETIPLGPVMGLLAASAQAAPPCAVGCRCRARCHEGHAVVVQAVAVAQAPIRAARRKPPSPRLLRRRASCRADCALATTTGLFLLLVPRLSIYTRDLYVKIIVSPFTCKFQNTPKFQQRISYNAS